jgi:DNA-binding transcriptional ArsR family regulator
MRAVLEADVHFRGQLLALKGPDVLFGQLSAGVDYRDRTLRLDTCKHDIDVQLEGNGLLLIPSVFMLPRHFTVTTSPLWRGTYQYAARGVAGLWNEEPIAVDEAFERLLSGSRARLLRLLVTPATTSELAARFGVSASAVSQHLGWLKGAGLVAPQRRGRSVFYELSPIGAALLEAYGEIEHPRPDILAA